MGAIRFMRRFSACTTGWALGLVLTAGSPAAAADPALWVAEPIALSADIEMAELRQIGLALRQELSATSDAEVTFGREALRFDVTPAVEAPVDDARVQLNRGEELYMAFEFARGAALLAEAAGRLSASLADLSPEDLDRLYRARLLEGVAWIEAGQKDAAATAFKKLLTLRPDFEPDPQLLPPSSRALFERARDQIFTSGVATIAVQTSPPGAAVLLDGRPRGQTPTVVPNVPLGSHGLRVTKTGFRTHSEELVVRESGRVDRRIDLEPSAILAALSRIEAAAIKRQAPNSVSDDLALIATSSGAAAIVLIGIERQSGTLVTSALRWAPGERPSAVVAVGDPAGPADLPRMAKMLVDRTWPAEQIPSGSIPVPFDFESTLLGLGGTDVAPESSILTRWWFWTIVGAAAIGGGVTAGVLLTRESEPTYPARTTIQVSF